MQRGWDLRSLDNRHSIRTVFALWLLRHSRATCLAYTRLLAYFLALIACVV